MDRDIIVLIFYILATAGIWKTAWLIIDQQAELKKYKLRVKIMDDLFEDMRDEIEDLEAILQQRRGKYD